MRFHVVLLSAFIIFLAGFPVAVGVEAPGIAWSKTYGGKYDEEAYALVETSDGGFAIAGTTDSGVALDFCLVKTEPAISPLIISIISPENKTYTTNSVSLNFTVNKPAKWMAYSLDGKANVTIDGNTTLNELPNGSHNITVYATDLEGNTAASKTVYFTVDAPQPTPITLIATASGAAIIGAAAALLLYHKYYKKRRQLSHKSRENTL